MRNLLLSTVLIAVPIAGFALVETVMPTGPSASAPAGLGDLSLYKQIVTDTQAIAQTGDLAAAELRITDLEKLWDDNAAGLRKADPGAWSAIDSAADQTFTALRARQPDPAQIKSVLNTLETTLANPVPQTSGAVQWVAGVAVTDQTGHALPCEEMIRSVSDHLSRAQPTQAVSDLQAKALERCNADDDTRADAFSAQALALLTK